MPFDSILKNIGKHICLDKDEQDLFIRYLHEKEVPKKELLLREGDACRSISYVHSGALRAYFIDKDGRDSTIMFAINDWWITDMYCFVTGTPAMQNIVAIEDSFVLQLHKTDLDRLYVEVPKFERFFRIIMQNSYIREQLRVLHSLSLPAEERYNIFVNKYPQLLPFVTQKQIASYLGITPEFLSLIRKNKTRKRAS